MKKSNKSFLKKIDEFFYSNFKLSLSYVKGIRNYIWFASLVFFCFALIGLLLPIFFQEQIFELISELIQQTEGLDTLNLIRFIFINNLRSSFFALFLGIFFGLIPLIITVVNGYVLGFVANKTILSEGPLVLWRLLPHGIFEIPAVMISIALGLKLGSFIFVSEDKSWKELGTWLIDMFRVFVFIIVPLLVVAGIIEGFLIVVLG